MNLCSDNHDEVCFEGRNCPVCEIVADKDLEIAKASDRIKELEDIVETLENDIATATPEPMAPVSRPSFVNRVRRFIFD